MKTESSIQLPNTMCKMAMIFTASILLLCFESTAFTLQPQERCQQRIPGRVDTVLQIRQSQYRGQQQQQQVLSSKVRSSSTRRKASEWINSVSIAATEIPGAIESITHNIQHLQTLVADAATHHGLESLSTSSSSASPATTSSLETILSTLYVDVKTNAPFYLGPAKEHTNPLFGPPDPYLTAGKSIVPPNLASLLESGTLPVSSNDLVSTSAQPESMSSPDVQAQLAKGYKILDANRLAHKAVVLPGFQTTGGILPHHNPQLRESPEIFARQVEWAAGFMTVLDKLPFVAFWYALAEFLLVRPSVDFFKEDIEEEPLQALQKTVMVTSVRMGIFFFLTLVTLGIVGM